MTENLVQYGTIFAAYGCKFNYNSQTATLDIIEGEDSYVEAAIKDIKCFDNTANYLDGAAALALSTQIDGKNNPLSNTVRANILNALRITKDGLFVYQVLSLQKNNRSWHYSEKANACSYFNSLCTHRGINPNPNHKGRSSTRSPNEYHIENSKGLITREQLVTPALEYIFSNIPKERLTSGERYIDVDASVKKLKTLSLEDRLKVISQLQEV